MAPTILIKFCVFIVHSKANNMTLLDFARKIPSPNVAPKPSDQSYSNSISGVPLQIFPVSIFFDIPLK